ncbi:MAG TPA: SRPBCC family protein [Burkholderiales bacterium]|jgi:hypothetical protein
MTIECPVLDVYNFIVEPRNLPKWASGLASGPGGAPAKVRFVERNKWGVLDHYVTVGSGPEVYMPMRVFQNGDGAELLITVFRQPGVTEEKFVDDTQWVRRDLEALKELLEK